MKVTLTEERETSSFSDSVAVDCFISQDSFASLDPPGNSYLNLSDRIYSFNTSDYFQHSKNAESVELTG